MRAEFLHNIQPVLDFGLQVPPFRSLTHPAMQLDARLAPHGILAAVRHLWRIDICEPGNFPRHLQDANLEPSSFLLAVNAIPGGRGRYAEAITWLQQYLHSTLWFPNVFSTALPASCSDKFPTQSPMSAARTFLCMRFIAAWEPA